MNLDPSLQAQLDNCATEVLPRGRQCDVTLPTAGLPSTRLFYALRNRYQYEAEYRQLDSFKLGASKYHNQVALSQTWVTHSHCQQG